MPLKVSHGDQQTIVEPGACQLIEASKIKLAAVGSMPRGMTMIGRFDNSSEKKYSTSISVAQSAKK